MSSSKKINIIYIAGSGRSGSTILELLLNTFDNVWAVGEIHAVPWELEDQRQVCGCGKKAGDCEFWQEFVQDSGDALAVEGEVNRFRESQSKGKVLRLREIFRIFFKKSFPSHKGEKFCWDNYKFLSAARDVIKRKSGTDIEYFTDMSKNPYRLYWLLFCSKINVKVIHLTKDPRAYVYSMIRNDDKPSLLKALRKSLGWLVTNFIARKITTMSDSYSLNYEEMASRPESNMKKIAKWLELDYESNQYTQFRRVENHGLTGNNARLRDDDIYLDERWKSNLKPLYKPLIKFITYFLGKERGYF